MENAAGSAEKEMGNIRETLDFKMNDLKQTWVGIVQELIDRGTLGDFIDGLKTISELLLTITQNGMGIPTIMAGIAGMSSFKGYSLFNYKSILASTKGFSTGGSNVIANEILSSANGVGIQYLDSNTFNEAITALDGFRNGLNEADVTLSNLSQSGLALGRVLQNTSYTREQLINSYRLTPNSQLFNSNSRELASVVKNSASFVGIQNLDQNTFNDAIRSLDALNKGAQITDSSLNNLSEAGRNLGAQFHTLGYSQEQLTVGFNALTRAEKMAALGANILNAALNMAVMFVVTAALSALISKVKELNPSIEELTSRVNELNSKVKSSTDTAKNNAKVIEDLSDRYNKLSKGVDRLGNNVSLSEKEFKEYHDIVNKIANMSPELVSGWDDQNNAIINLTGGIDSLIEKYKEAQKASLQEIIDPKNIKDSIELYKKTTGDSMGFFDSFSSFAAFNDDAKLTSLDKKKIAEAFANGTFVDYESIIEKAGLKQEQIAAFTRKELGLTYSTDINSQEFKASAKAVASSYKAEVESAFSNLKLIANAYLQLNPEYDNLNSDIQKILSMIVNSINTETENLDVDNIGGFVNGIIDEITSPENTIEIQNALINLFNPEMDYSEMGATVAFDYMSGLLNKLEEMGVSSDILNTIKEVLGFDDIIKTSNALENVVSKAINKSASKNGLYRGEKYDEYAEIYRKRLDAIIEKYGINDENEIAELNGILEESRYDLDKVVEHYRKQVLLLKNDDSIADIMKEKWGYDDDNKEQTGKEMVDAYSSTISQYEQLLEKIKNGSFTDADKLTLNGLGIATDGSSQEIEKRIISVMNNEQDKMVEILDEYIDEYTEAGNEPAVKALESLKESIIEINDEAKMLHNPFEKIDNTRFNIQNLNNDMEQLKSIYEDIRNGEDFDFSSIMANSQFEKSFSMYTNEYQKFVDTANSNSGNIKACQSAFNDLVDVYIKSTGALDNLDKEQMKNSKILLDSIGITNSAEMVNAEYMAQQLDSIWDLHEGELQYLAVQKEKNIQSAETVDALNSEYNAIETEISGLISENNALQTATQAQKAYALAKQLVLFDFVSGDIQQLNTIIQALGLGTEAWEAYYDARAGLEAAIANPLANTYAQEQRIRGLTENARRTFEKYSADITDIASSYKYEPPTTDAGGSGKDAAEEYVEAFNDELEHLKYLKENNFISEKEYLDRLKDLYEKYFSDLTKYAKEYYQYQHEYLTGMKDLYEKAGQAAIYFLNKEKDKYEEEKQEAVDALNKQKEAIDEQIKAKQKIIDGIQDEIDAMNEANEEREQAIQLQEDLYNLERLRHQRNKLVKMCQL